MQRNPQPSIPCSSGQEFQPGAFSAVRARSDASIRSHTSSRSRLTQNSLHSTQRIAEVKQTNEAHHAAQPQAAGRPPSSSSWPGKQNNRHRGALLTATAPPKEVKAPSEHCCLASPSGSAGDPTASIQLCPRVGSRGDKGLHSTHRHIPN